jgi:hypothetical protein
MWRVSLGCAAAKAFLSHGQAGGDTPKRAWPRDPHTTLGQYIWNQVSYSSGPMGPDEVLYINGSPPAVYGEAEKEGKWRGFQPINAPDAIGSW